MSRRDNLKLKNMIMLILLEIIAFSNSTILHIINNYVRRHFAIWPLMVYTILIYIMFGGFICVLANWMGNSNKKVSFFLLVINIIALFVFYRIPFAFPPLPLMLIGYFFVNFIQNVIVHKNSGNSDAASKI